MNSDVVQFGLTALILTRFQPGESVERGESNRFNGFPDYLAMKTVETAITYLIPQTLTER